MGAPGGSGAAVAVATMAAESAEREDMMRALIEDRATQMVLVSRLDKRHHAVCRCRVAAETGARHRDSQSLCVEL
jgi:hypothetical protein